MTHLHRKLLRFQKSLSLPIVRQLCLSRLGNWGMRPFARLSLRVSRRRSTSLDGCRFPIISKIHYQLGCLKSESIRSEADLRFRRKLKGDKS